MASDFLFLDGREIDVPAAGNFLNKLERLIKEADSRKVFQLKSVAGGLGLLLEKTLLDDIDDKEAGFNIFEKGITLMQEIGDSFKNTGSYEGDIETFMESIAALTGEQGAEVGGQRSEVGGQKSEVGGQRSDNEQPATSNQQPATSNEIQDDSLLKDFIVEGLEYIDEIEVNLLNLEQDPENPTDYR
jgi:two-component system chemotaxis sensor kinase CheA